MRLLASCSWKPSRAGAMFGDVKHDPLQSGGLGTPAHLRVESGAIHRANKGLFSSF